MAGENTAPQTPTILAGGTRVHSIDCRGFLDAGETITGTPTVTEQTTADLTITNVAVNVAAVTISNASVSIGKAIQCKISGHKTTGSPYTLKLVFSTSGGQLALPALVQFAVGTS